MMQLDSKLKNSRKTEYKTAKIQKKKKKSGNDHSNDQHIAAEKTSRENKVEKKQN